MLTRYKTKNLLHFNIIVHFNIRVPHDEDINNELRDILNMNRKRLQNYKLLEEHNQKEEAQNQKIFIQD